LRRNTLFVRGKLLSGHESAKWLQKAVHRFTIANETSFALLRSLKKDAEMCPKGSSSGLVLRDFWIA
jgi:hypothetical protein